MAILDLVNSPIPNLIYRKQAFLTWTEFAHYQQFLTSIINVNVTHGIAGIRIANGGEITVAIFE